MTIVDGLTLFVLVLVLWTFVPGRMRKGVGPVVHAVADAVRGLARPVLEAFYRLLCWVFGVERTTAELGTVKHFIGAEPASDASPTAATGADEQTDEQTDQVSGDDLIRARLKVDRTRATIVELLVDTGWSVGEIRAVLKGDNGAIGAEVQAARQRLGLAEPEPRNLRVRDAVGERSIVFSPDRTQERVS